MSNIDQFVFVKQTTEGLMQIRCRICGKLSEVTEFGFSDLTDRGCVNCIKCESEVR